MSRAALASRAVLAVAAAVSVSAAVLADASGAASPSTWSVLHKVSVPSSYYSSISGAGTHDAWAVGAAYFTAGHYAPPPLAHWDGTRWTDVAAPAMPKGVTLLSLSKVVAASAGDLWTIGSATVGASRASAGVIAHRVGGRWTTRVLAAGELVSHLSVVGPSNVWVLGEVDDADGNPVHGMYWHWNGSHWNSGRLGAVADSYSDDAYYATATLVGSRRPVLLHYVGGRWAVENGPRIVTGNGPGGGPKTFAFTGIVRRSATDVDLSVAYFESQDPLDGFDVYHWNGTSWTLGFRSRTGTAPTMCGDGAGGVWILDNLRTPRLLDVRHGKIVATSTYRRSGEFAPDDITLRPGTRRVWLAGGINTNHAKQDVAQIVGYRP